MVVYIYKYIYGLKKERCIKWGFLSRIALELREREDDEEFVFFSEKWR